MKKLLSILLLLAMLCCCISCEDEYEYTVTEEEWVNAFSASSFENVTVTVDYDFTGDLEEESTYCAKGMACLKLDEELLMLNVIYEDDYQFAMCTNEDYYFYYNGQDDEWYKISREDYPNYEMGTTREEQVQNFNLSFYYSDFTYSKRKQCYIANDIEVSMLADGTYQNVLVSEIQVQFHDGLLYRIFYEFPGSTSKRPIKQSLYFTDYGETLIVGVFEK